MSELMTLWLASEDTERDLVAFLNRKGLRFRIKYVPFVGGPGKDVPILFTGLGTFEGELSIRRAASVLESLAPIG